MKKLLVLLLLSCIAFTSIAATRLICYKVEVGVWDSRIQNWKMTYPKYRPDVCVTLNRTNIEIQVKGRAADIYQIRAAEPQPKSDDYFEQSYECNDKNGEKYMITYRYTSSSNETKVTVMSSETAIIYYCVEGK